ncbi:hypothetical protein [Domibacillus aminovorans]|uniref:hypothetical protein n=1 Tax=Domibacillus aminovorans TaxID=29332 RepID=UPI000A50A803|nr:hypothetical protein [Domibacillus aminovorans]
MSDIKQNFESMLQAFEQTQDISSRQPTLVARTVQTMFDAKQKEPYLAKQIADEFAGLATNVINGSGNSPQVKQKLSGVYQAVSEKAMMPEQQKALEIAGYVSEAVGRLLFRDKSIEIEALDRIIGPEFTRHANKPHLYVDLEAKAE